mgnify:CR=1 FL=1
MKKIRFYLNKDLDKFIALQFLDEKAAGIDFGKSIIKIHPKLKKAKKAGQKKRQKIIGEYFDEYYDRNRIILQKKLKLFRKEWRKKENDFFNISTFIFNDFEFQKGMYICYLSIIDCNPRFLESKTFQVFYKKTIEEATQTIAHELLHFIFFDFLSEKMKKEMKILSKEDIWNLSEIFNVVILKSNLYKDIIDKKTVYSYPEHRKYLLPFERIYKESTSIKDFILKGIKILDRKEKQEK